MHVKSFPYNNGNFTKWVEIKLDNDEIQMEIEQAMEDQINLFEVCIEDAKKIANRLGNIYGDANKDIDIMEIASQLFQKRASHLIYYLDEACRRKFEEYKKRENTDE